MGISKNSILTFSNWRRTKVEVEKEGFLEMPLCQNVDFHFIVRFEDRGTETGPRRHPLNNKVSDKLPRVDQLTIDIQFLNLLSQVFFHGLPIELFPAGF